MATIRYTTFTFSKPPQISSDDYVTLKEVLTQRPDYNINPPSSFVELFKGELIFLGIGTFGFLIASLDLEEWLNVVGSIPAIFAFFLLFSFVPSLISYLVFISDKSRYYSILKQDLIKSNSYAEFTILRNKR
jgi:hypothetical protein